VNEPATGGLLLSVSARGVTVNSCNSFFGKEDEANCTNNSYNEFFMKIILKDSNEGVSIGKVRHTHRRVFLLSCKYRLPLF